MAKEGVAVKNQPTQLPAPNVGTLGALTGDRAEGYSYLDRARMRRLIVPTSVGQVRGLAVVLGASRQDRQQAPNPDAGSGQAETKASCKFGARVKPGLILNRDLPTWLAGQPGRSLAPGTLGF